MARPAVHERIVLYQPGRAMVVIDEVGAERPSVAHFHLHPALTVGSENPRRLERDGRVVGWIDTTDGGGRSASVEVVPPDDGDQITAHYPAFGKRAHHPVLKATMVERLHTVISLGDLPLEVETLWTSHSDNACTIVLRVADDVITIRRVAGHLYLEVT